MDKQLTPTQLLTVANEQMVVRLKQLNVVAIVFCAVEAQADEALRGAPVREYFTANPGVYAALIRGSAIDGLATLPVEAMAEDVAALLTARALCASGAADICNGYSPVALLTTSFAMAKAAAEAGIRVMCLSTGLANSGFTREQGALLDPERPLLSTTDAHKYLNRLEDLMIGEDEAKDSTSRPNVDIEFNLRSALSYALQLTPLLPVIDGETGSIQQRKPVAANSVVPPMPSAI